MSDNTVVKNSYAESCKDEIKKYIAKSNKTYDNIALELEKYNIKISGNALRLRIDRNPDYYLVKAIMEIIGYKLNWRPFNNKVADTLAKELTVTKDTDFESLLELKTTLLQLDKYLSEFNDVYNLIDTAVKRADIITQNSDPK